MLILDFQKIFFPVTINSDTYSLSTGPGLPEYALRFQIEALLKSRDVRLRPLFNRILRGKSTTHAEIQSYT